MHQARTKVPCRVCSIGGGPSQASDEDHYHPADDEGLHTSGEDGTLAGGQVVHLGQQQPTSEGGKVRTKRTRNSQQGLCSLYWLLLASAG